MMNYFAHQSSYIDPDSRIGDDTKIWHFCHIMSGATVGKGCNLGQNVFVASGVMIGNNVKIQNNVSLYTGVIVEDDVFLGPSCVLTNVSNPRSAINRRDKYEQTLLKKGCTVGANSTIVCGITIGSFAFIGAGAVVTADVQDYALMLGVPAKHSGWVGIDGIKLVYDSVNDRYVCPLTNRTYMTTGENLSLMQASEK